MAYFTYLYYGPVYLQVKGLSATQSGVRLIPNSFGLALGSFVTGLAMRLTGRYYYINLATETLFVFACALMFGTFDINTEAWPPFIAFSLGGLGYGSILTITL